MCLRHALLLLPLVLAACDASEPCALGTEPGCPDVPDALVYVGNQGNFADNNGTLTLHAIEAGTTTQDAVPTLGGLVQALAFGPEGRLFVLLNFSTGGGRVDVVDPDTRARTAQIAVPDPRGIAFVGTRAYVSSLFAGTVTPVDLATNTAGTPIPVGANPEGVAAVGSRVYVANGGFGDGTTVSVVDAATNTVVQTVDVGCRGPRSLVVDAQQEVWVLCTGALDFQTGEVLADGEAVVLDGTTGAVVTRIALTGTLGTVSFGHDAHYSVQRRQLHVVQGQTVLRFDTETNARTATLDVGPEPIAGVGVDEVNERLYLGRLDPSAPNPYVVAGFVSVHDRAGARVGSFPAGLVPAAFAVRSTFGLD